MEKEFSFEKASEVNSVKSARGLAKWFSVKVEISIFGNVIWSYQCPPQNK